MGVRLRVQPLLLWMLGGVLFWSMMRSGLTAALWLSVYLLVLMSVVVIHELAHAVVARRFGVRVLDITLWPLGGMARLAEMPESPRAETWIALAGPLANFALALAAFLPLWLATVLPAFGFTPDIVFTFGMRFVLINAALGLFNLLPAFPMDGGRVLRAQLARHMSWLRATENAVRVSRILAGGLLVLGLVSNPLFLFIGAFILWASWQELSQVRARHAPGRSALFDLFQYVLRPRPRPEASNGHAQAWEPPTSRPLPDEPEPVPERAAARPPGFELYPLGKRGFSAEDVERLERWHGRLPRTASSEDA